MGHKVGALDYIQKMTDPIVVGMLGLPSKQQRPLSSVSCGDYGAAGLFMMQKQGMLDPIQMVSLVVTLFVPCISRTSL